MFMKKCKVCGKKLEENETEYCKTCIEFHDYFYSNEELDRLLEEYERMENESY